MKKTLTDIDGALNRATPSNIGLGKDDDTTVGIYTSQGGQLGTGNKVVQIDGKSLLVDDTEYKFTPGLQALMGLKHPRLGQYDNNDKEVYKSLVAQTKARSFPNRTGTARPHATWKLKHMLKKMVIHVESIEEESEDTDDTASVESETASIGDIGESSDISSPGIPPSPLHTRSYGKAKKEKDRKPYKKGSGVVNLPGDINGLAKKLRSPQVTPQTERIGSCIVRIA